MAPFRFRSGWQPPVAHVHGLEVPTTWAAPTSCAAHIVNSCEFIRAVAKPSLIASRLKARRDASTPKILGRRRMCRRNCRSGFSPPALRGRTPAFTRSRLAPRPHKHDRAPPRSKVPQIYTGPSRTPSAPLRWEAWNGIARKMTEVARCQDACADPKLALTPIRGLEAAAGAPGTIVALK